MLKTLQVFTGNFVTTDSTGALAAASVGPAGVLYVAGTATADAVTISGANPYKFSVTLPALTAGQSVAMYVTATVGGIATAAFVAAELADTKRVSDLVDAAAGLTAQQTRDAMKLAPTSGAPTAGSVDAHLDAIPTTISPTVAISATAAAAVASGTIAIETHSTFSQAITSTSTAALNTATKLWLAIKADKDDADSAGLVLLEATGGLTVLAQATYATVANGTLVLSGSSGAWVVTAGLASTATGLLAAYVDGSYHAAIKYKIASGEFVLWTGMCEVSRGVVQAVA
jgi:hypothetical protein